MSVCSTHRLLVVGGFLLLALSVLPAGAQTGTDKTGSDKTPPLPITGKSDPKLAKLDELMTAMVTRYKLPGAVLAVAQDGKLVYSRGFGYADRENKQVMKADALFRISSISKPFTAAAIMRLIDKGKLSLDDKVMEVLGLRPPPRKFDQRWKKITIRHLP